MGRKRRQCRGKSPTNCGGAGWLTEGSPFSLTVFEGLPDKVTVSEVMKKWTAAAGMTKRITYHSSRHTFATMMLTLGADLYTAPPLFSRVHKRQSGLYSKKLLKFAESC